MQNNTLSRAELDAAGDVLDIHYGDVLIKYGSVLDATDNTIPHIISGHESANYAYLQDGDIIVADTAEDETVGKTVELLNVSDRKIEAGLHTVPCRPLFPFASKYLGYYMNSPHYHKQLIPLMQGIKVLSISKGNISKTEITSPQTIAEQEKISHFLYLLDQRAATQCKIIDALKKYKRGLLQDMFPQKGEAVPKLRLAGFIGAWEQRKVSELFRVTRGYVLASSQTDTIKTDEMPYPVYSSQTKDKGLMGYYKDYLYEDAITWTTDGANAGTVNYRAGKFYCTNVCGVLLSNEVKANQMIAEALNNVAKGYVSYVGNPKLMNNVMADIVIHIPTKAEERELLSSLFSNLDNLITLHQRRLDTLMQCKNGMLQQLFI